MLGTSAWQRARRERCAALGHKGVLFGSQPQVFGEPHLVLLHA